MLLLLLLLLLLFIVTFFTHSFLTIVEPCRTKEKDLYTGWKAHNCKFIFEMRLESRSHVSSQLLRAYEPTVLYVGWGWGKGQPINTASNLLLCLLLYRLHFQYVKGCDIWRDDKSSRELLIRVKGRQSDTEKAVPLQPMKPGGWTKGGEKDGGGSSVRTFRMCQIQLLCHRSVVQLRCSDNSHDPPRAVSQEKTTWLLWQHLRSGCWLLLGCI